METVKKRITFDLHIYGNLAETYADSVNGDNCIADSLRTAFQLECNQAAVWRGEYRNRNH